MNLSFILRSVRFLGIGETSMPTLFRKLLLNIDGLVFIPLIQRYEGSTSKAYDSSLCLRTLLQKRALTRQSTNCQIKLAPKWLSMLRECFAGYRFLHCGSQN